MDSDRKANQEIISKSENHSICVNDNCLITAMSHAPFLMGIIVMIHFANMMQL
jgi:hypothetical protein